MTDLLLTCTLTVEKILVLFLFILAGYLLCRTKFLPENGAKTMSRMGTCVFFPAYLICNLSSQFTRETLASDAPLFLWGLVFLAGCLLTAFLLAKCFKTDILPRNTLIYIFAFSNYGYFGYPVMEGVFGSEYVAKTILFAVPSSIAVASIGFYLLGGKNRDLKKTLLSPTMIGIVIGCALGLSGLSLPKAVADALKMASNCMSPVSMLLTGFVLGKFKVGTLFKSPLAYLVSAVRLIAVPLIFGGVLLLLGVRGYLLAIPVIISAMPVGMNTVMFTESAGLDSGENARVCFASNLMGLVTIPLAFAFASWGM